jgi:hypothetical protein
MVLVDAQTRARLMSSLGPSVGLARNRVRMSERGTSVVVRTQAREQTGDCGTQGYRRSRRSQYIQSRGL